MGKSLSSMAHVYRDAHPGFAHQVGTLLILLLDPEVARRSPPSLEVSTTMVPNMSPRSGCRTPREKLLKTLRICVLYVSVHRINVNITITERTPANFPAVLGIDGKASQAHFVLSRSVVQFLSSPYLN